VKRGFRFEVEPAYIVKVYAAQRDVDVSARAAGCDGDLGSEGISGRGGGGIACAWVRVVVEAETLIMTIGNRAITAVVLSPFALVEQFAREGGDFRHRTHVLRSPRP